MSEEQAGALVQR